MAEQSMTLSDRLAEIETRCAKATKGPWRVCETGPDVHISRDETEYCNAIVDIDDDGWSANLVRMNEADMEFIAHARTDVPLLTKALRRAVERLTQIRQELVDQEQHGNMETEVYHIAGDTLADLARLLGEGERG